MLKKVVSSAPYAIKSNFIPFLVNVNACDRDGKTALVWACSCGFSSIANLLLNFGADIELKDSSLYSALMWAASRGNNAF